LECHTTFSQSENWQSAIPTNRYNKENIVFGIDCQRCHGPVVDHVKHHRKNPIDSVGRKILSYKSFSQQQRIDMCALCHSGVGKNINQAAFSFTPGDVLKNYLATQTNNEPDVHSNQVGLLEMSQCFIKSEGMDCMTCHDPHSNERNNVIKFNSRCIECHPSQQHTSLLPENTWDCVKCHMPMKASKIMKIEINSDSISQVLVRTHKIAIYKE
jgi:predicted CXXCH cytochrome family protein